MLCEHCKMREATVRYVEVVIGVKTEHNLCAQCAGHVDIGQYSAFFDGEFPLGKLLSGLLGMADSERTTARYAGVVCPTCGTTYEEFVKDSQFGCPDCYSVFDPLIHDNINHLQGSVRHTGKRPKYMEKLTKLRETENMEPQPEKEGESASASAGNIGEGQPENGRSAAEQIVRLLEKLQQEIRLEEFEEAAALRDMIRKLKEETKQDGKVV